MSKISCWRSVNNPVRSLVPGEYTPMRSTLMLISSGIAASARCNTCVERSDTLDREWLDEITELLEDGTVAPTLDTVFPLAEAQQAHELSENGDLCGKIILTTSDTEEN